MCVWLFLCVSVSPSPSDLSVREATEEIRSRKEQSRSSRSSSSSRPVPFRLIYPEQRLSNYCPSNLFKSRAQNQSGISLLLFLFFTSPPAIDQLNGEVDTHAGSKQQTYKQSDSHIERSTRRETTSTRGTLGQLRHKCTKSAITLLYNTYSTVPDHSAPMSIRCFWNIKGFSFCISSSTEVSISNRISWTLLKVVSPICFFPGVQQHPAN